MESTVLVKAFALLEALCAEPVDRSLAELASSTHLPKPTVHRILKSLVSLGYVQRGEAGIYRVSDKLRRLNLPRDDRRILEAATPVLANLFRQTEETVNLGVLREDRVIYLSVTESNHPLRRVAQQQEADPFYCTALGRAMVAHIEDSRREAMLRRAPFAARTPHTITSASQLRATMESVRRNGFAIEENETDIGVMCIAAPAFEDGRVVAAISLSVPSARVEPAKRQQLIHAVRDAAAKLTAALSRQPITPRQRAAV
jgi:DNA-binding IclR family transcriptional regulator